MAMVSFPQVFHVPERERGVLIVNHGLRACRRPLPLRTRDEEKIEPELHFGFLVVLMFGDQSGRTVAVDSRIQVLVPL